eukprot:1161724-Pelagomonas_calceolata.AAC.1
MHDSSGALLQAKQSCGDDLKRGTRDYTMLANASGAARPAMNNALTLTPCSTSLSLPYLGAPALLVPAVDGAVGSWRPDPNPKAADGAARGDRGAAYAHRERQERMSSSLDNGRRAGMDRALLLVHPVEHTLPECTLTNPGMQERRQKKSKPLAVIVTKRHGKWREAGSH